MRTAEWIGVPVVVLGELSAGFDRGTRREENYADLDEFLASPVVEVIPVDRQTASIYAEIVTDLRRQGTPISTNDIWIAATAVRAGASLLTWDEHFSRIARLGSVILRRLN
jgi:tRNA(fMet)-specific endonuclease VapC